MDLIIESLAKTYALLAPHLDERTQRLWCAAQAQSLGHGGITKVQKATGVSRPRITRGMQDLLAVTITNNSYINAWCVAELFRELRKIHIDGPITVILDNAKYQRCYVAERAAHMFNIELLYLPPYSPNLNLIERAWKFVKKKALNNRSFANFQLFQEAIYVHLGYGKS